MAHFFHVFGEQLLDCALSNKFAEFAFTSSRSSSEASQEGSEALNFLTQAATYLGLRLCFLLDECRKQRTLVNLSFSGYGQMNPLGQLVRSAAASIPMKQFVLAATRESRLKCRDKIVSLLSRREEAAKRAAEKAAKRKRRKSARRRSRRESQRRSTRNSRARESTSATSIFSLDRETETERERKSPPTSPPLEPLLFSPTRPVTSALDRRSIGLELQKAAADRISTPLTPVDRRHSSFSPTIRTATGSLTVSGDRQITQESFISPVINIHSPPPTGELPETPHTCLALKGPPTPLLSDRQKNEAAEETRPKTTHHQTRRKTEGNRRDTSKEMEAPLHSPSFGLDSPGCFITQLNVGERLEPSRVSPHSSSSSPPREKSSSSSAASSLLEDWENLAQVSVTESCIRELSRVLRGTAGKGLQSVCILGTTKWTLEAAEALAELVEGMNIPVFLKLIKHVDRDSRSQRRSQEASSASREGPQSGSGGASGSGSGSRDRSVEMVSDRSTREKGHSSKTSDSTRGSSRVGGEAEASREILQRLCEASRGGVEVIDDLFRQQKTTLDLFNGGQEGMRRPLQRDKNEISPFPSLLPPKTCLWELTLARVLSKIPSVCGQNRRCAGCATIPAVPQSQEICLMEEREKGDRSDLSGQRRVKEPRESNMLSRVSSLSSSSVIINADRRDGATDRSGHQNVHARRKRPKLSSEAEKEKQKQNQYIRITSTPLPLPPTTIPIGVRPAPIRKRRQNRPRRSPDLPLFPSPYRDPTRTLNSPVAGAYSNREREREAEKASPDTERTKGHNPKPCYEDPVEVGIKASSLHCFNSQIGAHPSLMTPPDAASAGGSEWSAESPLFRSRSLSIGVFDNEPNKSAATHKVPTERREETRVGKLILSSASAVRLQNFNWPFSSLSTHETTPRQHLHLAWPYPTPPPRDFLLQASQMPLLNCLRHNLQKRRLCLPDPFAYSSMIETSAVTTGKRSLQVMGALRSPPPPRPPSQTRLWGLQRPPSRYIRPPSGIRPQTARLRDCAEEREATEIDGIVSGGLCEDSSNLSIDATKQMITQEIVSSEDGKDRERREDILHLSSSEEESAGEVVLWETRDVQTQTQTLHQNTSLEQVGTQISEEGKDVPSPSQQQGGTAQEENPKRLRGVQSSDESSPSDAPDSCLPASFLNFALPASANDTGASPSQSRPRTTTPTQQRKQRKDPKEKQQQQKPSKAPPSSPNIRGPICPPPPSATPNSIRSPPHTHARNILSTSADSPPVSSKRKNLRVPPSRHEEETASLSPRPPQKVKADPPNPLRNRHRQPPRRRFSSYQRPTVCTCRQPASSHERKPPLYLHSFAPLPTTFQKGPCPPLSTDHAHLSACSQEKRKSDPASDWRNREPLLLELPEEIQGTMWGGHKGCQPDHHATGRKGRPKKPKGGERELRRTPTERTRFLRRLAVRKRQELETAGEEFRGGREDQLSEEPSNEDGYRFVERPSTAESRSRSGPAGYPIRNGFWLRSSMRLPFMREGFTAGRPPTVCGLRRKNDGVFAPAGVEADIGLGGREEGAAGLKSNSTAPTPVQTAAGYASASAAVESHELPVEERLSLSVFRNVKSLTEDASFTEVGDDTERRWQNSRLEEVRFDGGGTETPTDFGEDGRDEKALKDWLGV